MAAPAHKAYQYVEQLIDSNDEFTSRRAIREIQALLPDAPDLNTRAQLLSALAIGYSNLRDEERSLAAHRNAILTEPKNPIHYTNHGVSLQRFGHRREALDQFLRSVELPGGDRDPVALGNLAVGLWDEGLAEDALRVLDEGKSLVDPSNYRSSLTFARMAAMIGQDIIALGVLARLAATYSKVEIDLGNPLRTIQAASPEVKQAFMHHAPLARVLMMASEIRPGIDSALRSSQGASFVSGSAQAEESEIAVFGETAPMRARANAEPIGDDA